MAIDPSVQRRMTFSGDYGMDKWVVYKTGSVTASSGGGLNRSIVAHNLGYTPLIYVQWSETSDFSVPRELLQNYSDMTSIAEPWIIRAGADEVNIVVFFQNMGSSSKTIYYRVWGLAPHNISQRVTPTGTVSGLSPLVFNGEQNYLKPYMSGSVTVTTSNRPLAIDHNLGYVPTVMVWIEQNEAVIIDPVGLVICPMMVPRLYFSGFDVVLNWVTETQLIFSVEAFTTVYHYRIYLEPIHE